jgi:hypothetical protein
MKYQFEMPKGKDDANLVPTHVSVGDREYRVDPSDRTLDAPARFEDELALHGFFCRQRPSVDLSRSADEETGGKESDAARQAPPERRGGSRVAPR